MSRPENIPLFNKALIATEEERRGRDVVTNTDWNTLFNLHRYQGNHSEEYLESLDRYLLGDSENAGILDTMQGGLDNKSNVGHTHSISDVDNLQDTLNEKAASEHTHGISDITDLQDTLDSKSEVGHTHYISDITDLDIGLESKVDKILGKGLSTNDFTDALKTKLEGITPSGQVAAIWGEISGDVEDQTDLKEYIDAAKASGATNIFPYPYKDFADKFVVTGNGLTFTVNPNDGSITVSGTATATTMVQLCNVLPLEVGEKYNLSGCPNGGSYNGYQLCDFNTGYANDYGDGYTFTADSEANHNAFKIRVASGTVCNNLVFKPMLVKAEAKPEVYIPPLGVKATRDYLAEAVPNILPYPFHDASKTTLGVTITITGDATIRFNGTSTGEIWFSLVHPSSSFTLAPGTYSICGCPSSGSESKYYMTISKDNNTVLARDSGHGATFTITEPTVIGFGIKIKNNISLSNIEFKPMLVPGDMIPKIFRAPEYMATFAKTKAYNNAENIAAISEQLTPMTEAAYNALQTKQNRLYFLT